jgi:hypothetical protein
MNTTSEATTTEPTKPSTKKSRIVRAVASGRRYLGWWLQQAADHGVIYYTIPHVASSGMSRRITLHTIIDGELCRLWPSYAKEDEARGGFGDFEHSEGLDAIAKDWSFSFKHQKFVIGGCGMDMVFALVNDLAGMGLPRDWRATHRRPRKGESEPYKYAKPMDFANHVERRAI